MWKKPLKRRWSEPTDPCRIIVERDTDSKRGYLPSRSEPATIIGARPTGQKRFQLVRSLMITNAGSKRLSAEESTQEMREKAACDEARVGPGLGIESFVGRRSHGIRTGSFRRTERTEAAKLLGWTTTNVKVRAFRARRKLEKILQEID